MAIGNPDEWLVQPGPMSPNVIEAHIVEEAVGHSPKLRDLWEAFLVYCEVAAIKRSKPTGLWGRLKRYVVSNTVVLRFSDPRARSFVAHTILESRVRRWNLVYE